MRKKIIRFFDLLISLIILIIFSPLIISISLLIFTIDGKPVFFRQQRIGYRGKKFKIFKFRTMKNRILKNENLRLTLLGKILRRLSLDELPQFLNVLVDDMSIVGPRPLPKIIENRIKKYLKKKRRNVLPGITGLSQINYTGQKRKLNEKVKLDIEFVENYTLYNYFVIILKTPLVLIIRLLKNKSSIIQ